MLLLLLFIYKLNILIKLLCKKKLKFVNFYHINYTPKRNNKIFCCALTPTPVLIFEKK